MVGFNLSPKGRPTDLHVISHYPSNIFDVAAIRTISKWRFRITGDTRKPVGMRSIAQEVIFQTEYNPRVGATLRWLCLQPPARTLIVETAPESLGGHTLDTPYGQWADLVTVRLPPGKRLVNGRVKLNFCVNSHGNVVGTKIANASPTGLYDHAASAALSTWNFSARKIDGKAVGTCGLSYEIHIIAETTLEHGPFPVARMPIAVNLRGLGDGYHRKGAAIIRISVEADGSASHVEVVSSKPNANYGKLAVSVIRNSKYWPRQSHGNPVRTCNVKQTVEFHFGRQGLVWGNMGVDYNEVPYAVYPGG